MALFALLLVATVTDIRSRRIPNTLIVTGLCLGFGLAFSFLGNAGWLFASNGAATGLLLMLPLFLLRACGAGDVKLMMLVGSLIGAQATLTTTLYSLIAGGVLALAATIAGGRISEIRDRMRATVFAFAIRDIRSAAEIGRTSREPIPFAVAILVGTVFWALSNNVVAQP